MLNFKNNGHKFIWTFEDNYNLLDVEYHPKRGAGMTPKQCDHICRNIATLAKRWTSSCIFWMKLIWHPIFDAIGQILKMAKY